MNLFDKELLVMSKKKKKLTFQQFNRMINQFLTELRKNEEVMMTKRVPRTFQQLNDIFNMGKFVWETGRNEVTPDAEIELLMEQKKKRKKWVKRK